MERRGSQGETQKGPGKMGRRAVLGTVGNPPQKHHSTLTRGEVSHGYIFVGRIVKIHFCVN